MTALVELFLSAIDVVKAEFQRTGAGLVSIGISLGLIVAAFLFLVLGLALGLAAAFLGLLETGVHPALAALITGLGCLIIAWSLSWFGRARIRGR